MKKYVALLKCIALLLGGCLAAGIAAFWFVHIRASENNRIADIEWHKGGDDMSATIHVVDVNGNPIPRTNVVIRNNSGNNCSTTDEDGRAILNLGELDVQEIKIGDQTGLLRPYAFWIGTPSVRHGLIFEVKMKSPVQGANSDR